MVNTWVKDYDFTLNDGGWRIYTDPTYTSGLYSPGVGFTQNVNGNTDNIDIFTPAMASGIVKKITVYYDPPFSGINPRTCFGPSNQPCMFQSNAIGSEVVLDLSTNTSHYDEMEFNADPYAGWGQFNDTTVVAIRLEGIGENPFLKHNSWGDCNCSGVYAAIDAEMA